MKRWLTIPLLAIALILPALGFAQNAAQLELARKAVALQQGVEQKSLWNDMANSAALVSLEKWQERAIRDVKESRRADTSKKLDAELEKLYASIYKLLEEASPKVENEELVNFYAENFTEAELKALVEWFESPAFKKYQQMAPQIAEVYMNSLMERTYVQVQSLQGTFDSKAASIINAAK
ncbi:MAG: DUF2059 domain-containing protein [Saezia sp.]